MLAASGEGRRIVGPEGGDRGNESLLRHGSPSLVVAHSNQRACQAEHRLKGVGVVRAQDPAAPIHALGQDLACSGVILDRDQDAAQIRQGADDRQTVLAHRLALPFEEGFEGGASREVVGNGSLRQSQVVQGTQRRRVLGTECVSAAGHDALVDRASLLGPVHIGQRHGHTVRGGEGVQVARSEDALAALQQDGVLVSGDRIVVQFQADGGD